MTRRMNDAGRSLLKRWEGLRLTAYQDTNGTWTIGWGHTKTARPDMAITEAEAEHLLTQDLRWAEAAIDRLVTVDLTDCQFAALVVWCFNIGETEARKSTLVRLLNKGRYDSVPGQLARWKFETINGKKVESAGLMNRRSAEVALWAQGDASSPVPVPRPASPERSSPMKSKTIQAGGAASVGLGYKLIDAAMSADWRTAAVVAVVLLVVGYMMRERLRAWADGWT